MNAGVPYAVPQQFGGRKRRFLLYFYRHIFETFRDKTKVISLYNANM